MLVEIKDVLCLGGVTCKLQAHDWLMHRYRGRTAFVASRLEYATLKPIGTLATPVAYFLCAGTLRSVATRHRGVNVSHHARIGLSHGPQAIIGTCLRSFHRPGIQASDSGER